MSGWRSFAYRGRCSNVLTSYYCMPSASMPQYVKLMACTTNPFPDLVLMRPVFFHTSRLLLFKTRRMILRIWHLIYIGLLNSWPPNSETPPLRRSISIAHWRRQSRWHRSDVCLPRGPQTIETQDSKAWTT